MTPYPKRLIEVDLPIARISTHARREKSIRHGHISTLHIWWARRPLAACRAVILASLWPDPVDLAEWAKEADAKGEIRAPKGESLKPGEGVVIRPKRFLDEARQRMNKWAQIGLHKASPESYKLMVQVQKNPKILDDPAKLRASLLDFVADFADWDHSTDKDYLETSRALVQAAHESLGGEVGTRPLVIDPFAGGGSIPLEALRVGADAFASDLNPIPILLNKVALEYIPKYGQRLADEARKWGQWVKQQAEKELSEYYPQDKDGSTPIAYMWARTVLSEAPGQGDIPVEVPLIRALWLAKKANRKRALRWVRDSDGKVKTSTVEATYLIDGKPTRLRVKRPVLEVFEPKKDSEVEDGTVARGSATCPVTGFTTRVEAVRTQLNRRQGGAWDARLLCVVSTKTTIQGRFYRVPTKDDEQAFEAARVEMERRTAAQSPNELPLVPSETLPVMSGVFNAPLYGHSTWGSLFAPRQALTLTTLVRLIRQAGLKMSSEGLEAGLAEAVQVFLSLALDRQADFTSSLCGWWAGGEKIQHTFGRQALPMIWDFVECPVFADATGSWEGAFEWGVKLVEHEAILGRRGGHVERASADKHPLPDDAASAFISDPPYYNAVPYADLSDFFYVWLKRTLPKSLLSGFADTLSPKESEIVEMAGWDPVRYPHKDGKWFEQRMQAAMAEGRRITRPDGVGVVVFAHKSTSGWESQLNAMIDAGWVVTASWAIDTEMETRLRAMNSAALASSVHLVVRPRELVSGALASGDVGEWREVLAELPERLADWMPRLASEGVVGADAIFACLGPALEIFSRHSRVEKASGEPVKLREYLEHVWAAVSTEALSMIMKDADTAGLEPDARLTAMWLWTLGGGSSAEAGEAEEDESDEAVSKRSKSTGFLLEYDAARLIAQGLGIHLEKSESIIEVKGDSARLLPVAERTRYLFGKDAEDDTAKSRKSKKKVKQGSLFEELDAIEAESSSTGGRFGGIEGTKPGTTTLDKVHQSMILFAAGRGEALKRFLVEDGVGKDGRFWKLAQSFSALYPSGTDEKRWVDGVLARKKGLGF